MAAFTRLGIWQLDRLDERRTANSAAEEALASPPVAFDPQYPPPEYGAVTATGVFTAGDVLWVGRSRRGAPGGEVLTPLATKGAAVLVDRGWVALDEAVPAAPSGPVTVRGWWRSSGSGRIGAADPTTGLLTASGPDIEELEDAMGIDLTPGYIVAQELSGAGTVGIEFVEPPTFDDGNHLSYAMQWFLFAAIVAAGFPLLIRHTARRGNK